MTPSLQTLGGARGIRPALATEWTDDHAVLVGVVMQLQYIDHTSNDYRPGACNIGPREIARRRTLGVAGIAGAIVLGAVLIAIDATPLARALVLLPLWGGIVGLEQARRRFCAGFAVAGIRSAAGSDATEPVAGAADLAADRAAARRLVARCGAIALALTASFVVLPI
jgi:hypothetical protein